MPSITQLNDPFLKAMDRARVALAESADFIASLESHWRRTMQSSPAEALGCSDNVWWWIALCHRPRADHFREDVQSIALEAKIDETKLQNFLITALAVERFRNAPPEAETTPGDLLAARERNDNEK
jgi:hypothetical protein